MLFTETRPENLNSYLIPIDQSAHELEQSCNQMSQTNLSLAIEQSYVLADSPCKVDRSDMHLVEIFNDGQEQIHSPDRNRDADNSEENKLFSQGTASFGAQVESLKVMKTKSFTNQ